MFKRFKKIAYPTLVHENELDYQYASEHTFNRLFLIDGTNVYVNDEVSDKYLRSMGIACAALSRAVLNDTLIDVVSVDSFFMSLPDNVKAFFIQHEVGHSVNKDLDNMDAEMSKQLVLMRSRGQLPLMEVKADMYAA